MATRSCPTKRCLRAWSSPTTLREGQTEGARQQPHPPCHRARARRTPTVRAHHRQLLGLEAELDGGRGTRCQHHFREPTQRVLDGWQSRGALACAGSHGGGGGRQGEVELCNLGARHSADVGDGGSDFGAGRGQVGVVKLAVRKAPAEAEYGVLLLASEVAVRACLDACSCGGVAWKVEEEASGFQRDGRYPSQRPARPIRRADYARHRGRFWAQCAAFRA